MGEEGVDGGGNGGLLTTRVFVGGLGQAVKASDLENTFSSLGRVKGVEIVRTNGRSFAYMDFEPDSLKSFNKLFSMHSLPSANAAAKHVTMDKMNNVIGQHELDIMNLVLEKLFKAETESAVGTIERNLLREMNDVSITELDKEEAAEASDSDNLITNIALKGEDVSSAKELVFSMKQVPNADTFLGNKPPRKLFQFAEKALKLSADGEKQKESINKQASVEHLNDLVHVLENQAIETRELKEIKDVAGLTSVIINEAPPRPELL